LTIAVGTILGLGIGLVIARSSFAEGISQTALKTLHVSPSLAFSAAGGALAFLGSYFLISSNSESLLTRAVTASYNRVYGTEILARDIWMYQSGFSSSPKGYQLQMVQEYFMQAEILTLLNELEQTPFINEEQQALASHTDSLKDIEQNYLKLAPIFFENLASDHGDLYAQVRGLNSQLLQSTGNTALKEQLSDHIHEWVCDILVRLDKKILDSRMAAQVTLIKVLETFKEKMEFRDPRKANQWTALLSSLQQECRNTASDLINELQTRLGADFFQQPLTLLLWDTATGDDVFHALNELRKTQFERAGFYLNSH
ncbi:MAG TPA: hypothetical protein VIJ14_00235, partial [Rhabdochlamydiaceae bacterium]